MVFGSGFGTQSPAPSFHSGACLTTYWEKTVSFCNKQYFFINPLGADLFLGAYTPGIMTDVVREVKDAARVREDALLNRVKALVEERQWSMNESSLRMMRDIEELKVNLGSM